MPSLSTSLLLLANRLLPPVDLPGDTDPLEYARWENETATGLIEVYRGAGGEVRRALDVGCGYGGKTTRLRELDPDVEWTALDISQDHLRHAGGWFEHTGHDGIHRTLADAARLPFGDASFDRIVSADALEHLPEPEATLREFRRCLTPDGRIVLLFNPWSSPRGSHLGDLLALPWCQVVFSRAHRRLSLYAVVIGYHIQVLRSAGQAKNSGLRSLQVRPDHRGSVTAGIHRDQHRPHRLLRVLQGA